jgi:hypothetical protein
MEVCLTMLGNVRLGEKWMTVTNTQAYYGTELIATVKKVLWCKPSWYVLTKRITINLRLKFIIKGPQSKS